MCVCVSCEVTHQSTVRPHRCSGCVRAIIQLQEVVVTISRIIDVDLVEGHSNRAASRCHDAPLTLCVVGVCVWVVGTCKCPVVPIQSSTTTYSTDTATTYTSVINRYTHISHTERTVRGGRPRGLESIPCLCEVTLQVEVKQVGLREDGIGQCVPAEPTN